MGCTGTAMDRIDKAMDRTDIVCMICSHISELYFGRMLRYDGNPGVGVPECGKEGVFGHVHFPAVLKNTKLTSTINYLTFKLSSSFQSLLFLKKTFEKYGLN